MMVKRFLQEFKAASLDKGYEEDQRLNMVETVRLIQDLGYLSDPRRTDPTASSLSVIEEPLVEDLWKYLTANCKETTEADHGQLPPDAGLFDIKVFLLAIMGCQDIPWMKIPIGLSVLPESL